MFERMSDLPLAQVRNGVSRRPRRVCADTVPLDVHIEQVRPAIGRRAFGALEGRFELRGFGHDFAFDAETRSELRIVDVRIAEVAGHIAAGLELASADIPDAVAFVVVTAIVANDERDRRLVTGVAPERLRAGKQECAV